MANVASQIDPQALQQALAELHDIQLPAEPGLWPLAPGWWLLMALMVTLILVSVAFLYWWRRSALKRAAMAEWQTLAEASRTGDLNDPALLKALARLLKRVALTRNPRAAALTDQRWADYLNQQGQTVFFTTKAGQQLLNERFSRVVEVDAERQLAAVHNWLKAVL